MAAQHGASTRGSRLVRLKLWRRQHIPGPSCLQKMGSTKLQSWVPAGSPVDAQMDYSPCNDTCLGCSCQNASNKQDLQAHVSRGTAARGPKHDKARQKASCYGCTAPLTDLIVDLHHAQPQQKVPAWRPLDGFKDVLHSSLHHTRIACLPLQAMSGRHSRGIASSMMQLHPPDSLRLSALTLAAGPETASSVDVQVPLTSPAG